MGEMLSFIQHTWDSGGPSHSICYYSPSTVFRSFSHVTCAPFMVQSVGESNDPDPELSLLGFASDTLTQFFSSFFYSVLRVYGVCSDQS